MNKKISFMAVILVFAIMLTSCGMFSEGQSNINGTYTGVFQVEGRQSYAKAILNNGNIELRMGYLYGDDYVSYGTYTVSGNIINVRWDVSGNTGTITIDRTNNNLITDTGITLRKTI
ncbi:MAG: hypothetical protein J6Y43_02180 [Clostridia bacterium]|nr:hypothetical protein [Clostridia bacterium]